MQSERTRGLTFFLVALFFLSGVSGLVYQTVWMRMLIRTFGVTVYAVTTIVVVFMSGLAIGGYVSGRFMRGRTDLLKAYAIVEVLIGLAALLSNELMVRLPFIVRGVFSWSGDSGAAVTVIRFFFACLVLLPPTILMGSTLPLISGFLTARKSGIGKQAGLLYGANTLGAVAGVAVTGLFLIAVLGERSTVMTAAALNILVGILSWLLAVRVGDGSAPKAVSAEEIKLSALARSILLVSFASGFCALAFEVIWARILNLLLGNSVYGFTAMLSAYLIGLGVGSAVMSRYVGKIKSPLAVFGMMEVANAIIGLLSLQVFLTLGMREPAAKYSYALIWGLSDFWRLAIYSALIIVPVTLLYGAIFPVAVRLVGEGHRYSEEAIGRLYAYNTVGGILGSAATGFMLIPLLGTTMAFVSMSVVSLLIGIYLLIKSSAIEPFSRQKLCIYAGVLAMTLAVSFSFKDPFLTVLMKRFGGQGSRLVAHREDPGATLTVFEDKERTLYINGLYVSNTSPNIGELMVNLPLAFNSEPGPKKVLVIGMGVGSALRYGTDVGHHITNVELHPGVVELFKQFNPDHQQYLENPKNKIVFNDGRNFLFNTEEKFDLILVDGSPPFYAAGMVNLYSLNFARLAKAHLTDSGVFAIWLPIVCFESDVWMVIKNFSETFESIKLYTPKGGSNGILMGNAKKGHFSEDFNQFAQQLSRWGDAGLATPMMQGMTFSEEELRKRAAPYSTVTDNHPHTEFPLQNFLRGEPYYADNRFLFEP